MKTLSDEETAMTGEAAAPEKQHAWAEHAQHGLVRRQDLLASGMTRRMIKQAEVDGVLGRVSRSYFAEADAHAGVLTAAAAGGSLTCVSALRLLDVWTLGEATPHHIRRPERRRRDGRVPGAIECRSTLKHRHLLVDSLDAALEAVVLNHSNEDAIVAIECVLNKRLRTRPELEVLLQDVPSRKRRLLGMASSLVESPMESLLKFRLWQHRVRVRPQVEIEGVGRVDFLIGNRLIIEVDSIAHHTDKEAFGKDRGRDRKAAALGYVTLRFTSVDILTNWPHVLATILSFVSRDAHRPAPKP